MNQRLQKGSLLIAALLLIAPAVFAQGTAFTYQGRLTEGSTPSNGTYEMEFKLFDAATAGTQQPQPLPLTLDLIGAQAVTVTNGVFTVQLDFGATAFTGAARYLEIGVRHVGDASFTTLMPRQPLTATPYAIQSLHATTADTAPNFSGSLGGDVTGPQSATVVSNVGGQSAANIAAAITLMTGASSANTANAIVKRDASGNFAASTITANLSGNATTATTAGNVSGVVAIANGGTSLSSGPTQAGQFLRSTGSGAWGISALQASDLPASSGSYIQNTTSQQASSNFNISGNGTVGGTLNGNTITANKVGSGTTGPNFKLHIVDSGFPSIRVDGSNAVGTWLQLNNTGVGGHNWGILSSGSGNGEGAGNLVIIDETGGGSVFIDNPLTVQGSVNTTAQYNIGSNRVLGIGGQTSTFVGLSAGAANPSGTQNSFFGATAGQKNTTGASNSFFGYGAGANNTTGLQNVFLGASSGGSNTTENSNTFLGFNTNGASGILNSTAIGANAHVTRSNAIVLGSLTDFNGNSTDTFIGIGTTNPLTKLHVVENDSNVFRTLRLESSSTTGNWLELINNSTGAHNWAIISAGTSNTEGAGNLVISDETGGGRVVMNNTLQVPNCSGCTVAPSDRNLKSNFAPVNSRTILKRLSGIPIQTWNYKSDEPSIRHLGPMAQDFFAAFGVGADDRHINLLDEAGVALAAIQELYREQLAKDQQIEQLKTTNADLKASNAELQKRLAALEERVGKLTEKQH